MKLYLNNFIFVLIKSLFEYHIKVTNHMNFKCNLAIKNNHKNLNFLIKRFDNVLH